MGRDLLQQIWQSLHKIQSNLESSLEALSIKHQAVFAEGLGKVKESFMLVKMYNLAFV